MEVYEKLIRKGHQQNEIKIFAYFCIFIYIVCQAAQEVHSHANALR